MQYSANTPSDYIDALEEDWRKQKLLSIRDMLLSHGLEESIEYKMLRYGDERSSIFHLNAQKGYVSLYVGNIDKVEDARTLLSNFDMGKGCIRIKKTSNTESEKLKIFIEKAVEIWRSGGDLSC